MKNQQVWNKHYTRDRSRLEIPDENVVRYLQGFFAKRDDTPVVLDLGCGSGRHLEYLKRFDAHVIGQDFSLQVLTNLREYGIDNPLVNGTAQQLPFVDGCIDLVLIWGVLHYLTDEHMKQALLELRRVLKPGGRLFLTLRSSEDSHLEQVLQGGDLADGSARLFSKDEAIACLNGFTKVSYGFILRQPLASEGRVAHHMLEAQK